MVERLAHQSNKNDRHKTEAKALSEFGGGGPGARESEAAARYLFFTGRK
jgi:hypothetical protein